MKTWKVVFSWSGFTIAWNSTKATFALKHFSIPNQHLHLPLHSERWHTKLTSNNKASKPNNWKCIPSHAACIQFRVLLYSVYTVGMQWACQSHHIAVTKMPQCQTVVLNYRYVEKAHVSLDHDFPSNTDPPVKCQTPYVANVCKTTETLRCGNIVVSLCRLMSKN